MLKRRDILERLIYLDADFISSAYEEIKDVSPETSFTKMEAVGAEGGRILYLVEGIPTFVTCPYRMIED